MLHARAEVRGEAVEAGMWVCSPWEDEVLKELASVLSPKGRVGLARRI